MSYRGSMRLMGALLLGASLLACSSAHIKKTEVGYAAYYDGALDEAEQDFQSALKKSADFEPALTGMGLVAYDRGDYKAALDWFNKAVNADRTADALYGRGLTLLKSFQWDKAKADLKAAAEAQLVEANLELSMAAMLTGEPDLAFSAAKAYASVEAATPERRLIAAQMAYRTGAKYQRPADAIAVVELFSFEADSVQAPELSRMLVGLSSMANDHNNASRRLRKAPTDLDFGFVYRELSPVAARTFEGVGGAVIDYVHLGSPAERAGLRAGDILTGFEAFPVVSAAQLSESIVAFQSQAQQQPVALLEVLRGDAYYAAYMKLGQFTTEDSIRGLKEAGSAAPMDVAPDDLAMWP